ncbi:M61 family metallopeptidase [Chitinophagaceae bacterium LWZ2-11]
MKNYCLSILLSCTAFMSQAQKIEYIVSFPNVAHHEAEITLIASSITAKPAIFRMSRSSPGRYATHEFGKNVYNVKAFDKAGKTITINRIDGDVYEVPQHGDFVKVTYTLYGNYADGTYVGIDPASIHLNMPGAFMWMKGMDEAPIQITFDVPKENKGIIATQLKPTDKPNTFTAPGLQYFMDSPTKIGDLFFREWQVQNPNGKNFNFRLALEATATQEQVDTFATKLKKLVNQTKNVFGEFPNYDYGSYTFIASINPYVYGDGMEHRNSTMITSGNIFSPADRTLGVFAHEFFHCWNVERIRPKTIEPFNFEKSNMSNELWCAEGFTQYYGNLNLARAGFMQDKQYLMVLSGLVSTKQNTPGAKFYSPIDASNGAVFVDAGVAVDKTNYPNMFTSYYTYGAAVALSLDLELQTRYNKTLDAFMQEMWKRFGKTEIAYTIPGMQEALATVSDKDFSAAFFKKYIYGHEAIDYASLLAKAGYELKNTAEGQASLGAKLKTEEGKTTISSNTVIGTAAYEAGLDINDELIKLDNTPITKQEDVATILSQHKVGDAVAVVYKHRGIEKQINVTLKEAGMLSVVPIEQSGKTVTGDMQKIRDTWFK